MKDSNFIPQFCIAIDFEKGAGEPTRVFRAICDLINSFNMFDADIITSINSKIEPVALLEDVEAGSVKAWLKYNIQNLDDEALKSGDYKRIIGHYLVRAKHLLVKFLEDKTEVNDRSQIEGLEKDLFLLAKDTDVLRIPAYSPVTHETIIKNIKGIVDAAAVLGPHDRLDYSSLTDNRPETVSFNLSFKITPEAIEDLLTKEIIKSQMEMILKVKKPDYLGDSMWEFKHEKRSIPTKIVDHQWLKDFQDRKIDIRPGDSIRARVEISTKYSYDNEVISSHFSATEIIEVIPFTNDQTSLFDNANPDYR